MVNCFNKITASAVESPSKKKQRQLKDITDNILKLMEEKAGLTKAGESTDDVDENLQFFREQRKMLISARASAANLSNAFDDAA